MSSTVSSPSKIQRSELHSQRHPWQSHQCSTFLIKPIVWYVISSVFSTKDIEAWVLPQQYSPGSLTSARHIPRSSSTACQLWPSTAACQWWPPEPAWWYGSCSGCPASTPYTAYTAVCRWRSPRPARQWWPFRPESWYRRLFRSVSSRPSVPSSILFSSPLSPPLFTPNSVRLSLKQWFGYLDSCRWILSSRGY